MGDFTVNVRQKPMDFNRWQLGLGKTCRAIESANYMSGNRTLSVAAVGIPMHEQGIRLRRDS